MAIQVYVKHIFYYYAMPMFAQFYGKFEGIRSLYAKNIAILITIQKSFQKAFGIA